MATDTKRRGFALAIYRCPVHHDFLSIMVDDSDTGAGTRITSSKCCGRWKLARSFPLDSDRWRELADLAEFAADTLEAGD